MFVDTGSAILTRNITWPNVSSGRSLTEQLKRLVKAKVCRGDKNELETSHTEVVSPITFLKAY